MLQAIRSRATGLVVQILFGVLILTFALWGIGDIFRGRGADTSVATVGGEKIDGTEVSAALRRQVDRMRQITNATLNDEQIKELGLLDTVLTEVINQHLLDLEAQRLGLAVNDGAVRQAIVDNPAFHGTSGQFDRNIYLQLLQSNRMTDQQYESLLRNDLIRNRIVATVTDGAGAPGPLIDALWQSRGERRVAVAIVVPPSAVGTLPTPDAAALQKYYDAHKDSFMVPERRSFTVALIDPSQYAAAIKIPDDQIKVAYDKRRDEFVEPEKRDLQQILLQDEAKAKAAAAAISGGKDFAAVAKENGETAAAMNLGALAAADMPGALGKAVFALKAGAVTKPIKDSFGWHIVKVVSVTPEKTASYDTVKSKLATELAQGQAADQVAKTANSVDDALAGGASLKDVVAKFGLKTVAVADIDAAGRDASGKEVKLPAPSIVKTAFATSVSQPSDLKELPDQGYYLIAVDKVTPAAPQPLAQVRDKVLAAWQANERAARLAKLGEDYASAVNKGQKLEDLAALHGLKTFVTQPLSRYEANKELPPDVTAKLFTAKQGQAVTGSEGDKGVAVATVSKILPPDPAKAAAQKQTIAREIEQSTKGDLLSQYEQSLRQRYPVSVNRDALDHLL
ncbi:MAG: SurA N-terminal domain-containing protein [Stellaceae bacterium]